MKRTETQRDESITQSHKWSQEKSWNFNLELSAKLMTHDAFAQCFHQHDSMYSVGYNHDAPPHEVSVLRLPSLMEGHSEPQNLGA